MDSLSIAILTFSILELINVIILYTIPHTKVCNGLGVFDAWHKACNDDELRPFIKYLANWVANTKLIFILLLQVILWYGSTQQKVMTTIVMILSIAVYYLTLHPIIRKLDKAGQITPKNYSIALGLIIAFFIIMFSIALIIHII